MPIPLLDKSQIKTLECLINKQKIKLNIKQKRFDGEYDAKQQRIERLNKKKEEEEAKKAILNSRTYKQVLLDGIHSEEKSEIGRKLFIGKINIVDIRNNDSLHYLREQTMKNIFKSFGNVQEFRCFLNKGFMFVVYTHKTSAEKALNTLKSYEKRKEIIELYKTDEISKPKANFYIRFPRT